MVAVATEDQGQDIAGGESPLTQDSLSHVCVCEYCLALLSVFSALHRAEGYVDCYCFAVRKKDFFLGIVSKAFQFLTISRCFKFI